MSSDTIKDKIDRYFGGISDKEQREHDLEVNRIKNIRRTRLCYIIKNMKKQLGYI